MKPFFMLVAFLAILLVSPAMAAPKTKTSFESQISMNAGDVSMGQQQILADGTIYVVGAISTGEVSGDIVGSLWTQLSGSGNLNTGTGSFQGKFEISNNEGTFEGNVVGTVNTNNWITGKIAGSFVGFGSGIYEKQKIKGNFDGEVTFGVLSVALAMKGQLSSKNA